MAEQSPDTTKVEALATQPGALALNEMVLIGTMGTEAAPRALIRFPGGRITQVAVGDALRGSRVDAIEPERLYLSRNGRQSVLSMPQG